MQSLYRLVFASCVRLAAATELSAAGRGRHEQGWTEAVCQSAVQVSEAFFTASRMMDIVAVYSHANPMAIQDLGQTIVCHVGPRRALQAEMAQAALQVYAAMREAIDDLDVAIDAGATDMLTLRLCSLVDILGTLWAVLVHFPVSQLTEFLETPLGHARQPPPVPKSSSSSSRPPCGSGGAARLRTWSTLSARSEAAPGDAPPLVDPLVDTYMGLVTDSARRLLQQEGDARPLRTAQRGVRRCRRLCAACICEMWTLRQERSCVTRASEEFDSLLRWATGLLERMERTGGPMTCSAAQLFREDFSYGGLRSLFAQWKASSNVDPVKIDFLESALFESEVPAASPPPRRGTRKGIFAEAETSAAARLDGVLGGSCGRGFLLLLLRHFEMNADRVVEAVFEPSMLPASLRLVDRRLDEAGAIALLSAETARGLADRKAEAAGKVPARRAVLGHPAEDKAKILELVEAQQVEERRNRMRAGQPVCDPTEEEVEEEPVHVGVFIDSDEEVRQIWRARRAPPGQTRTPSTDEEEIDAAEELNRPAPDAAEESVPSDEGDAAPPGRRPFGPDKMKGGRVVPPEKPVVVGQTGAAARKEKNKGKVANHRRRNRHAQKLSRGML
eukprot:Polyplicarium_translucidae@DN1152_c0_g1_i1.p1